MDLFKLLRDRFQELASDYGLLDEHVDVRVKALTPQEAIGNPEHQDYPLIKGKERMMEATVLGARGQAFTDMYGNFSGSVAEVGAMRLENNYRRAIFLATLNAIARRLKIAENTIHCRDDNPPLCAKKLVSYVRENYGNPRVALVGFQPRMAEALAREFALRVTDMDPSNLGTTKFGVQIQGPESTAGNIAWSDLAVVTGTTLTNSTLNGLLFDNPTVFYGVTIAAPACFLNLKRFCPYGT